MFEIETYDTLVIGSGEAGKYLAWTMAKAASALLSCERRYIGGSCQNIACGSPAPANILSPKYAHCAER